MSTSEHNLTGERADLLETLAKHRNFLRYTVRDLTDEQAAQRPTASELCLGGLIKQVTVGERQWVDFILDGPSAMDHGKDWQVGDWLDIFRMRDDDTLAGVLGGVRASGGTYRPDRGDAARSRRCAPLAHGCLVRSGCELVSAAGATAPHCRDRPARRSCRHPPGDPGRREVHGLGSGLPVRDAFHPEHERRRWGHRAGAVRGQARRRGTDCRSERDPSQTAAADQLGDARGDG